MTDKDFQARVEEVVESLLAVVQRQEARVAVDSLAAALGVVLGEAVWWHISRLPPDRLMDAADGVLPEALNGLVQRIASVAKVWLQVRRSVGQH